MTVESAADRAAMLSTDDFAVAATYGAFTINVIFDNAFIEAFDVATTEPQAMMASSDVTTASVDVGGAITINGQAYIVRVLEPDGTGMTLLRLEKQ